MAKQIKAYVEVETYVEVSQGPGADSSSLISSLLVTDEFGDALTHLAEAAAGHTAPARILSGPHGVGKSTLLSTIYALARRPELPARSPISQLRSAANYLSGRRLLPVFVDPMDAGVDTFDEALTAGLLAAGQVAASLGVSASDWETASTSSYPLAITTTRATAVDARVIFIVDGLSTWLQGVGRDTARDAVAILEQMGEAASRGEYSVLVAVDEDAIDSGGGPCAPLLRYYQVEYVPLATLATICDRFLFKKDGRQRADLGSLYDDLKRLLPHFNWSREDFIALYPLHPVLLEVTPALRKHCASFSLPRFASATGNRAKGRRELSLVVLDEPFDAFEYELRKNKDLAAGFEAYDFFANTVVQELPDSHQRLWAKLVLKGLFLCSLAGHSKTALAIANAMMLFDEADVAASTEVVHSILARFEERGGSRIQVDFVGTAKSYRMTWGSEKQGERAVADLARLVSSSDPRLGDLLVEAGARRFRDWPQGLGTASSTFEVDLPWRGTARQGLVGYRVPAHLEEIPPLRVDSVATSGPLVGGEGSESGASAVAATTVVVPAESICEYDWEVSILPMGWSADDIGTEVERLSTRAVWEPALPSDSDLDTLKRLAVLCSGDPRLDSLGDGVVNLKAEAEAETGLIFHRLYVEEGRLVGPEWEVSASDHAGREALVDFLAGVLDAPMTERFPQHPHFGGDLDEATARMLVERFFADDRAHTPDVQQAAVAFALPLGLAEAPDPDSNYRFNPGSDGALAFPFNVEPLRLAELGAETGVPLKAVYQVLRRSPYGLRRDAQNVILAAVLASGRGKLVGPTAELGAEGLATAGGFEGYTHLKGIGLTVYSNEQLLAWCRLLTEAEGLDDIVTAEGRQTIRRALDAWLGRWRSLDLNRRFNEVPPEAATRRTWQLIATSKQYFETTARCAQTILDEDVALEEGIARIVNTFAANPTMYQRAVRDLEMLTSFIDWVPTYTVAKEYVLAAERSTEAKIESQRTELLGFISAPHRLLDENKRRRYETVYDSFRRDYIEYYVAAHELHVGSRADLEALSGFLESPEWRRFELLSQVRVVSPSYYQLAQATIQTIHDLHCEVPLREIMIDRAQCLCSFRLSNADSMTHLLGRLRGIVEYGSEHHVRIISQYRKEILTGIREVKATGAFSDASVPLIALLSGNESQAELTPSAVDLINRCLADRPLPVPVALPSALLHGETSTKAALRERLLQWVDSLPVEESALIEIGQLLSASGEE
jgi:hypothetical protein